MAPQNDPPDLSGVTPGELGRIVRDTLVRFEGLATRLETGFVRTDNFDYYKQLVETRVREVSTEIASKASKTELDGLRARIEELEDDKKYLTRIVISFVLLLVLTGAVAIAKITGNA